jgi:CoA-transferase family III
VPTPDPGPLTGRTIAVPADSGAGRHAASFVAQLGATVCGGSSPSDVCVDIAPTAVIQDWATSGAMALTAIGHGCPSPERAGAAAAVRAGLAVTAALATARTGSLPSLPDIRLLGERAALSRLLGVRRCGGSASGATRTVTTCDGWCVISLARETDVELVPALVRADVRDDPWLAVREWAAPQSADAVAERAELLGLAAAVVPSAVPTSNPESVAATRGGPRAHRDTPLVIDLSSLWAGPLCASLLAMTGAEVVKVEDVRRLDGARSGPAPFYDLLHEGHASVLLDLDSAAGRDELRDLIASADVVIEASRPRALHHFGIEASDIAAAGTIWAAITAYGRNGPWSNRVGFGDDVAAAAGLVAVLDGVPVPCGDAVADPLAGVYAAAAISAALLSGHGWLLDVSMREVAAAAAAIPGEPCDVVATVDSGWLVEWADGQCPVAPPVARDVGGRAAAPGADNARILGARTAS